MHTLEQKHNSKPVGRSLLLYEELLVITVNGRHCQTVKSVWQHKGGSSDLKSTNLKCPGMAVL